ncbi:MAG: type IV toxin-antitoxin system AbiEi family antitoxin domain-containing protein [Actinomycetota bacterium]|nr:type IV toxin-antitoxin system AbiEi family antitoxin domain-containing protein [Actinomycetota bacterium]
MEARRALARIAAAQHGLVTGNQARIAGLTDGRARWLTRSGRWAPIRPGVYALAGSPPSRMQLLFATAVSLQPGAWLSHATAGELWGFPGVESEEVEVLTDFGRKVGLVGVRGHRSSLLFTADLTVHLRIPVTSPERTLVDLSARLTPDQLGRVLDDSLRRRLVRLERLRGCVNRLAGSPGRRSGVVHALLAERLPGYEPGDSDLETRVLRLLVKNGFPPPVQQYRVRIGGRTLRVDLAYPETRLAIELDGWEFHRTRTAFDDDRARANLLVAEGWTLVRFTSRSSDAAILDCVGKARERFGRSGAA